MSISSRLKLAVVSVFKEAVEKDTIRFKNFAAFLGIDLNPKKKTESANISKEASFEVEARSKGKVREAIRDWFIQVMGDYLPIGYFDKDERNSIESRKKMYQYLPDDLFERMQRSISLLIGTKARDSGYKDLSEDDLALTDEIIDDKLIEMLGYYQNNPSTLESVIVKTFSPKKKETTEKKFEPGPGEMWFTPTVTQAVYDNYKRFIEENKEKYSEKSKKEGIEVVKAPEDLGIFLNKTDTKAINYLNELKNFSIDIHDKDISTDPREKTPTISITFSIPELASKGGSLYRDVLYTKKLPASMGDLRANKKHPMSVEYASDKGVGVKFKDKSKNWEENTAETFKLTGFTNEASYKSFITKMIYEYTKENLSKSKNLDDLIADLGGSVAIRGRKDSKGNPVTISTIQDLEALGEIGGRDLTKEELKYKRKLEQVQKRYKWRQDAVNSKLNDALAVWGPTVQEYLYKISPEDGKSMRETIVRDDTFETMEQFTKNILYEGTTKAGLLGLLGTKEIADKALQLIFDERIDSGTYAWKAILKDYIQTKGHESHWFSRAVKLIMYKENLESAGKKGAALKKALKDSSWSIIESKYSNKDVNDYLKKYNQNVIKGISTLTEKIKELVNKNENSPAFKTFFERLNTWNDIIGKGLKPKIEGILDGDEPSPIAISKDLKSKMVSERVEMDSRTQDEIDELEGRKKRLEEELKKSNKDPSKDDKVKELDLKITNLKDRAIKKEVIDVSAPGGSKYLDDLVDYLIEERLQKAYIKKASTFLNIIKLAKMLLK